MRRSARTTRKPARPNRSFTGQNQDLTSGSSGLLYDFLYREQHSTQGRWISPDPAGTAATDPTNPQTWNRYGYALNNPLLLTDPLGLDTTAYQWIGSCLYQSTGTSTATVTDGPSGPVIVDSVTWSPWTVVWCAGSPLPSGSVLSSSGSTGGASGTASQNSSKSSPCKDASNNRSRFFQQLPGMLVVAHQLNVPSKFIVGLASYESGWLDNHNLALNNPVGPHPRGRQ